MQNAMHELIEDAKAVFGEKLLAVILYGSYSRNEQTEESDVDIALILSSRAEPGEIGPLLESVSRTELSFGKVISVVDIEFSRYNEYRTVLPFYRNIDKEGIILWKKERRKSLPSA
ncbi:MAG: nucleotidyltransferase domain-containing protein [Spirochaetales bacterium]|nr:nucleotidyltransferase domain-containing protein [Spirochaetales bacterium]